jgi:uncharacterized membrane protein YtjA (UPF0391 family)
MFKWAQTFFIIAAAFGFGGIVKTIFAKLLHSFL